jgi:hypothetical protein
MTAEPTGLEKANARPLSDIVDFRQPEEHSILEHRTCIQRSRCELNSPPG